MTNDRGVGDGAELLPDVTDPLTAPHWAGLRDRTLLIQTCRACGTWRWPIAPLCPACLTDGGEWARLRGIGTVWSFVVYHRAFHPSLTASVPYAVAMVEPDDADVLIPARTTGALDDLRVGGRVDADFEPIDDLVTLLRWRVGSPDRPQS